MAVNGATIAWGDGSANSTLVTADFNADGTVKATSLYKIQHTFPEFSNRLHRNGYCDHPGLDNQSRKYHLGDRTHNT